MIELGTKTSFTDDVVYSFVCNNPGMCTYKIAKKLKMTGGRVRYALKKLEEAGLVKFKYEHASRTKKLCYPVDAWEMVPKEWKPKLRKLVKNLKSD